MQNERGREIAVTLSQLRETLEVRLDDDSYDEIDLCTFDAIFWCVGELFANQLYVKLFD